MDLGQSLEYSNVPTVEIAYLEILEIICQGDFGVTLIK